MTIWGHVIEDEQIIGIGPLLQRTNLNGFGETKHSFALHLRSYSLEIATDYQYLAEEEDNAEKRKEMLQEYFKLKKRIESDIIFKQQPPLPR